MTQGEETRMVDKLLDEWIGIAALACAVVGLLLYSLGWLSSVAHPAEGITHDIDGFRGLAFISFLISYLLISIATFKGERLLFITAFIICILMADSSEFKTHIFHLSGFGNKDYAQKTLILVVYLTPIAGSFLVAARKRKMIWDYIPAVLMLIMVLGGLRAADILPIGIDWGW
jgi:hypothetical protein